MPIQLAHRALYASFDRFPSPKGAATHIARMATTLFDLMEGGLLYVLGDHELPLYQREGSVEILRHEGRAPNFLERALGFGRGLENLLDEHGTALELCHVRDPWSGIPVLNRPHRYAVVYEVNGLPSIELPYRYPHISPATLAKIRAAEEFCWTRADAIITPSATIAENLTRLGADPRRMTVIPNGADIPHALHEPPIDAPERYILYFGALQRWQGVDTLLRAFARLADLADLHLVICASTHPRAAKIYRKLAERLGIAERVVWRHALRKDDLAGWLAGALLTVAPLAECSRNVEQGCAPLKVLESMAFGVPVVASDLPAVREIMTDGVDGRLVRPDRPADLARAIRVLLEYPGVIAAMGEAARERIAASLTWEHATAALAREYDAIISRKDYIFAPSPEPQPDRPEKEQSI
jgi:glycosyltransferase involved in cell wall biosynthesis